MIAQCNEIHDAQILVMRRTGNKNFILISDSGHPWLTTRKAGNMEKLLDLLLSLSNLLDARSTDPVMAVLKRAERGAVLAIFVAVLAIGGMIAVAPDHDVLPSGSPLALVRLIQNWMSLGCAVLALAASCTGLYQVGRYIVAAKWPERFVDFNQQRGS